MILQNNIRSKNGIVLSERQQKLLDNERFLQEYDSQKREQSIVKTGILGLLFSVIACVLFWQAGWSDVIIQYFAKPAAFVAIVCSGIVCIKCFKAVHIAQQLNKRFEGALPAYALCILPGIISGFVTVLH